MKIVPNKSYRLNPERAIYVTGTIDDEMVSQLTPKILKLQGESRDPITVYIDSRGGNPNNMETILRLLRLTDQDHSLPCDVITAVTIRAASAAADLLSSGDYAIAFPDSTILHHGIRTVERTPLTLEATSLIGDLLRVRSDVYAMQLAQRIESRFSFRYVDALSEFDKLRAELSDPNMIELQCFFEFIRRQLSDDAKKIWAKAQKRYLRYHDLITTVIQKSGAVNPEDGLAGVQASMIKAIVELEVEANKENPEWTFSRGGINQVVTDFFLLEEFLGNSNSDRLKEWCTSFGKMTLSAQQRAEVDSITNESEKLSKIEELARAILQPIWIFFVGLCHALQEGENELTAMDAFWMGLVDEVVGADFFTVRDLNEYEEDDSDGEENDVE